jgi:molybdate transport system substrate-binding protein
MNGRTVLTVGLASGLLTLVSGCSSSSTSAGSPGEPSGTLTILAASSLTDVMPMIGAAFEQTHSGITLQYSFAGSPELVADVTAGAPADVLALAGATPLQPIASSVTAPVNFAQNRLTIVVPPGNPAGIHTIADLARPGVKVVLADPSVPAGLYAQQMFDAAHLSVTPVSLETDVRSILTRVALGGADAGVVYVTDAAAVHNGLETVPIPDAQNVVATYPAVAIKASADLPTSEAFVRFLRSSKAQSLLRQAGFLPAPTQ